MILDDPNRAPARALTLLKSPWTWALLAGLGLVVALVLQPTAPAWLFWGAVAASCLGAFIATWLARSCAVKRPPG